MVHEPVLWVFRKTTFRCGSHTRSSTYSFFVVCSTGIDRVVGVVGPTSSRFPNLELERKGINDSPILIRSMIHSWLRNITSEFIVTLNSSTVTFRKYQLPFRVWDTAYRCFDTFLVGFCKPPKDLPKISTSSWFEDLLGNGYIYIFVFFFFIYLKKYFTDFDHSNGNGCGIFLRKIWMVCVCQLVALLVWNQVFYAKRCEKKILHFCDLCQLQHEYQENHACFWTFKHHLLHMSLYILLLISITINEVFNN